MSNFGKDPTEAFRYDEAALLRQVLPHLEEVKALGVRTVFDCTTAYFGRRVDLLKRMAEESGLQIVTNTGFYGAADDRYVPEFAFEASAEQIAEVWIKEFENGIEGTDIRPGFIKLAFDVGPPSAIDKKLFTAGLLTHLKTGLTLAVHTGDNPLAVAAQTELLDQYGVRPEARVWVHANWSANDELLLETAAKGGWISLDGAKAENTDEYIERLKRFKDRELLHKVLLSHDGDSYPMGGPVRPFLALMQELIPAMLKNGFTQEDVDQLTVRTPREAFSIRVRQVE